MKDMRTWEQMRQDNLGAAWIDDNGDFCSNYKRNVMRYASRDYDKVSYDKQIEFFSGEAKLLGWKQVGFNGCWSCESFDSCEKYLASFPIKENPHES